MKRMTREELLRTLIVTYSRNRMFLFPHQLDEVADRLIEDGDVRII